MNDAYTPCSLWNENALKTDIKQLLASNSIKPHHPPPFLKHHSSVMCNPRLKRVCFSSLTRKRKQLQFSTCFCFNRKFLTGKLDPRTEGRCPWQLFPFLLNFACSRNTAQFPITSWKSRTQLFLTEALFFFLTRPFSGLGEENLGSICKSSELPNFLQNSCAFNSCAKGSTDSCNFFNHNIGRKKDMHTCQKVLFCLSFRYAEPYIQKPVFLQVIQHNPIHV